MDETSVVDVEPAIWEALKSQWEKSVNLEFVNRCGEDEDTLWKALLKASGIKEYETITHGGHSLKSLTEPE